ncbi:MAG TPA: hypothetical protein VK207_07745, partial [Bacteroidales bacterium]|nr:hypothetical protein [Bacteroidales bacterium]
SDDGLDLWDNNGSLVLENSWAWKNGYLGDGSPAGDGCGFKFGKTSTENGTVFKRTVRNTVSVYNRSRGYMQNSANVRFNFYNNIAWKNPKGLVFSTYNLAHVFRNNIVFGNDENWNGDYSRSVRDHNSNDPSPVASAEDFISVDTTGMSGRRKSNGDLPGTDFMALAPGSDLIDAGVNVGLAFSGNAPDLGANESGSAAVAVDPVLPEASPAETNKTTGDGIISISPLTAKDHIAISNFNPGSEPATLKINDFSGKLCYELKLDNAGMMSDIPVKLAPGFYIARITSGTTTKHVQKLVFVK